MSTVLTSILGLAVLFVLSAFFSSTETTMFSLNRLQLHRIRRQKPALGAKLDRLMSKPTRLLSTILVGNTLVNVFSAALGFTLAEDLFPGRGEAISIPAMTLLIMLFGEVAPKRFAIARAEKLVPFYVPVIGVFIFILTPLRLLLDGCSRLMRRSLVRERQGLSEDEFLSVVEAGEEDGVLDEEERAMVDGIIRLEEMRACDVMTPRVDVVGLDLDEPEESLAKTVERERFRYMPVYRGSLDQPTGFLDVLKYVLSPSRKMAEFIIDPYFVPETAPLDSLLSTFQKEGRRVAFVLDEYGGTAGLISRGDMLDQIAEHVGDEFSKEEPEIQNIGPNKWLVDGAASLDEVNYELDISLWAEGADRMAGWTVAQMERIPKTGDSVEAQGIRATVRRMRHQRVMLVLIEKLGPAPSDDAGQPAEEPWFDSTYS